MKKSNENVDQHVKTNTQDPKATKQAKTDDSQSQRSASRGNQVQDEDEAANRPIGRAHGSKDDGRDSAAKTKGNKSQK